jgi:hypothetical protein
MKGFWSLEELRRQVTPSAARRAMRDGVNEPLAQATGRRLFRVLVRSSGGCDRARASGESTSRRSMCCCSSARSALFRLQQVLAPRLSSSHSGGVALVKRLKL